MKYLSNDVNWDNVASHMVNKNLIILLDNNTFSQKVLNKIYYFLIKQFSKKKGRLVVSEQIIENPLVVKSLRESDRAILDFGGYESLLALQLSALGYKVTVLDQRYYPFCHNNLRVWICDIFSDKLNVEENFDVIISISTIEHLGLSAYGDSHHDEDADKRGVEILWNMLNLGGRLMVSVPVGKFSIQRGYRVYDETRLKKVFPHATEIQWYKKEGREGTWSQVGKDKVRELVYDEPYGRMPVEAIAFIICDKD